MIRLVIADDHKSVRERLVQLLEAHSDYRVVGQACDGEQAVDVVLETCPDIVLMDINMPRLSGIDATRRIGRCGSRTRVLAMSTHESPDYVDEIMRAGACGYVAKGSVARDVFSAIDAVQSGASFFSEGLRPSAVAMHAASSSPPTRAPAPGSAALLPLDRDLLRWAAEGLPSDEIARKLAIPIEVLELRRAGLMRELGVESQAGLLRFAIRSGLLSD